MSLAAVRAGRRKLLDRSGVQPTDDVSRSTLRRTRVCSSRATCSSAIGSRVSSCSRSTTNSWPKLARASSPRGGRTLPSSPRSSPMHGVRSRTAALGATPALRISEAGARSPSSRCPARGAQRRRDLARKQTTVGPHVDDLAFFLDGREARAFASQGQLRALVLAWKTAEMRLLVGVERRFPGAPPRRRELRARPEPQRISLRIPRSRSSASASSPRPIRAHVLATQNRRGFLSWLKASIALGIKVSGPPFTW